MMYRQCRRVKGQITLDPPTLAVRESRLPGSGVVRFKTRLVLQRGVCLDPR